MKHLALCGAAGGLRGKDRSLCPPGWPPGAEIAPA